jgi:secondary thiamine-phosphate synthase enzyme
MLEEIIISTEKRVEIVDITNMVDELVRKSGVESGIAIIWTFHTTSAIVVNEGEPRLMKDILKMLDRVIPEEGDYGHNIIDRNADAHLRATLLGESRVIPVENGRLKLGTWQRVLFIELDGPRNRKVGVTVLG